MVTYVLVSAILNYSSAPLARAVPPGVKFCLGHILTIASGHSTPPARKRRGGLGFRGGRRRRGPGRRRPAVGPGSQHAEFDPEGMGRRLIEPRDLLGMLMEIQHQVRAMRAGHFNGPL